MKRLILFLILGFLGWQGYTQHQRHQLREREAVATIPVETSGSSREIASSSSFKCDGRTYCSQMTSCAEATFFLKNCPGVKMDGNIDGIPCEQQWCK